MQNILPPKNPRNKKVYQQVIDRVNNVVWTWDPIGWAMFRRGWCRLDQRQADLILSALERASVSGWYEAAR